MNLKIFGIMLLSSLLGSIGSIIAEQYKEYTVICESEELTKSKNPTKYELGYRICNFNDVNGKTVKVIEID